VSTQASALLRGGRPVLALRAQILRPGALLLAVLLAADAALVALHLAHTVLGLGSYGAWSLAADGGWAEVYQYVKWLWLALLTAALAWQARDRRWLPLTAGFLFLLDTDALRTHETVGRALGGWMTDRGLVTALPAVELGGLAYIVGAGLVLLPLVLWAWRSGSPSVQTAYRQVTLLMGLLLLVGVVLDGLFAAALPSGAKDVWGDLLEDGGEHVLASILVWSIARRVASALREQPGAAVLPAALGTD
jgi:hypothetical protein